LKATPIFAAWALAAAACAQVIDLGPEATLGHAAGGTGGIGAGGQAGAGPACGIPRAAIATCNDCFERLCCAEALVCAQDARCVQATQALNDCLYDITCVMQTNTAYADAPGFTPFQTCFGQCAADCMPNSDCLALATCCRQITDPWVHDACRGVVNQDNAQQCQDALTSTFTVQCP